MGKTRRPLSVRRKKRRLNSALKEYNKLRQQHAQSSEELPSTSSQSCSTDILFDHGKRKGHNTDNKSYEPPCKIKKEEPLPEFKQEELILDYDELNYNDGPRESMEYELSTESELDSSINRKNNECSGTTEIKQEVVESQFETVFCEESTVKIKQEIEDEDNIFEELDDNSSSNTVRPVAPVADLSSQPSTSNVELCRTKSVTRKINKPGRSKQASFTRCDICVNEYFASEEDATEHYMQKHSVTSQGRVGHLHPPDVSLGMNPPNKPPRTSSSTATGCDLLEGVFVSLKNIPLERREAAKDKIMELVGLIAKENVHPSLVQISLL